MIKNNGPTTNTTINYWEQWLTRISQIFRGTGTGRVCAELWAETIGTPNIAAMNAIAGALMTDEQCTRLGRVLPGDVTRLLKHQASDGIPTVETAITEIWREVSRVGSYAAREGFDDYTIRLSHPVIRAIVDTVGWMQLCECENRSVTDAQLRMYYVSAVENWGKGRTPPPQQGLRCIIGGQPPKPTLAWPASDPRPNQGPPEPEPETPAPMNREQIDELRRLLSGTIKHVDHTPAASARKALANTTPPNTENTP